jgi:hypothetical protein
VQAVIAAIPDEKARPYLADSALATQISHAPRVGLPVLEYSNPLPKLFGISVPSNVPGDFCAKVVATEIGVTTAPKSYESNKHTTFRKNISTFVCYLFPPFLRSLIITHQFVRQAQNQHG